MAIPVNYFSSGYFQTLRNEGIITSEMLSNQELVKGIACFTVHPTFLYEGLWNLALLIFLLLYRKKKKFDGELAMIYVAGYGLGRFWIEWMRTDSLMIGSLKVSQVVAAICFFLAVAVIVKNRIDIKNGKTPKVNYVPNKKTEDDSEDSESEESESKEESEEKESEDKKKKDKKNIKDKLKASKESDEEEESDEEDEDDVEEEPTDDAE
jgi:phosphatidylglycerol:prolipoprotein diacylglycerol transferase